MTAFDNILDALLKLRHAADCSDGGEVLEITVNRNMMAFILKCAYEHGDYMNVTNMDSRFESILQIVGIKFTVKEKL